MTAFQQQVLTQSQLEVLSRIGPFAESRGFYLAGGTAVALRLGHRFSEDFDWFAQTPTVSVEDMAAELAAAGIATRTKEVSQGTYHGQIGDVSITFLRYRYPMLEPPEYWSEYGCRVATLVDLACMKLSAISQRSEPKDFIDIYAILSRGGTLAEVLATYRLKFNVSDVVPVLYGLTYFDDAERRPMPKMLIPADWAQVKSAIRQWAREAAE